MTINASFLEETMYNPNDYRDAKVCLQLVIEEVEKIEDTILQLIEKHHSKRGAQSKVLKLGNKET